MKSTLQIAFDNEMQKLNFEFTRKRNAISQEREAVKVRFCERKNATMEALLAYRINQVRDINNLKEERAKLYEGDPKREQLGAQIKEMENELDLRNFEAKNKVNLLRFERMKQENELNDRLRDLTEWVETEKAKAHARYLAEVEEDAESERVRQANEELAKGGK